MRAFLIGVDDGMNIDYWFCFLVKPPPHAPPNDGYSRIFCEGKLMNFDFRLLFNAPTILVEYYYYAANLALTVV